MTIDFNNYGSTDRKIDTIQWPVSKNTDTFFKPTLCFLTLWFSLDKKTHFNKIKKQNFRSLNYCAILLNTVIHFTSFFYSVSKIHLCKKYVLTTYSVVSSVLNAGNKKLSKTNSLLHGP